MVEAGERLHVRNFPAEVKEWAQRRDLDMSKETRDMWRARKASTSPGHAALRSEMRELRRLIEFHRERADELEEKLKEIEGREGRLYGGSGDVTGEYDAWIDEKSRLAQFAENPAILNAAERFQRPPEEIVADLEEAHPPKENPLGLKSLQGETDD